MNPIALEQSLRASWPDEWPIGPDADGVTPDPDPFRASLVAAMTAHEQQRIGGSYPHLGQDNDIRRFAEWIADWIRAGEHGPEPLNADVPCVWADPIRPPETDEEPWDLTEGAVVYTARWLQALVFVAAVFAAVLVVRRLVR